MILLKQTKNKFIHQDIFKSIKTKKMKKLYIPIIFFLGLGLNAFSQGKSVKSTNSEIATEKSARELRGDKHYFVYSFDKAIDAYKNEKELSLEGQRKLAKSYYYMNDNVKSQEAYAKLINMPGGNNSEDYYNYAMVLRTDGKYDESDKMMDKFSEASPTDLRAIDYKLNKSNLGNLLLDNGKFGVQALNVNTEAEDFGPSFYKNKVVFTSTRTSKLMPKKSNRDNKPFLNIYVSEVDQNQLKKPEIFDKSLNGKMNEGPASFNKEGTFMAYTENNYDLKKKELIVKLEIYFRTSVDGKWSKPESFILNSKEYSVGHPALSSDGKTMYFASDMPGGFGGSDLYKITKSEDGTWSKAENLGKKINTEGNEMFPFYEETSKTLYFSSNGRFGLGGLDIFYSSINGTEFNNPTNAGNPLNTQYDDFAMIVDGQTNKGYFSSNRTGGSGDDDIYSVSLLSNKQIQGIAKNVSGKSIPKAFITLRDEKGNIIDTLTTNDDGAFLFDVEANKNFKLTGNKKLYKEGENVANTLGKEQIVIADVILLKDEPIAAVETAKTDLGKVLKLNNIYFDLDKFNIRADAEPELNKIIKAMNENPTMVVELISHTDCRETAEYNQILSDKRAKSSVEYIQKRITKPSRISGKGYGKTKLVNSCECDDKIVSQCSDEEHQKNRRTEFILIK